MELIEIFKKYFKPVDNADSDRINYRLCSRCGGGCCRNMGCHISPDDLISVTKDSIRSLINESGCISIDWWDGNPVTKTNTYADDYIDRVYFLRIKNKGCKTVDPSYGGTPCYLLTDTGCPLSFAYRPKGGRELIPHENNLECEIIYSKRQCAVDWEPYNDILKELVEEYKNAGDYTSHFAESLKELGEMVDEIMDSILYGGR